MAPMILRWFLVSLIFVIINTTVDLLYAVIDPRLRVDSARGAH